MKKSALKIIFCEKVVDDTAFIFKEIFQTKNIFRSPGNW